MVPYTVLLFNLHLLLSLHLVHQQVLCFLECQTFKKKMKYGKIIIQKTWNMREVQIEINLKEDSMEIILRKKKISIAKGKKNGRERGKRKKRKENLRRRYDDSDSDDSPSRRQDFCETLLERFTQMNASVYMTHNIITMKHSDGPDAKLCKNGSKMLLSMPC